MIVDIHSHINYDVFDENRNEVIERAKKAGVIKILASGSLKEANQKVLLLKNEIISASLGLYPLEVIELNEDQLQENLDFIKKNKNKVTAIGEIGLDFVSREHEKEQIKIFQRILEFSEKLKKPIVLHTRKAEKEVIEILETIKIKNAVFHCFTGNFKLVNKIVDNGWSLSIPPIITYSEHFQIMADRVPMNNILTETDAPYLSPFKDKINEPSYITYTIDKISEIKKMDKLEVEKNIFMNFQKIFVKK